MTDLAVGPAEKLAGRLLKSTARQSYDPDVDIDWTAPAVPGKFWMQPERMSLYGTKLWDQLDEEQRIELSKHEVASIASVGLWFEVLLMQVLLRDVYDADPRSARTQWALTEVGDETRHSVMFGRMVATMGVPAYGPRGHARAAGRWGKPALRGAAAYSAILIGEEPVDRWQRELMRDDRIQPLTRMMARIHVLEEARHVTFAREELVREAKNLGRTERLFQQWVTAQAALVTMRSLIHPDVYSAVGIDPHEGRVAALTNPNYRATIAWMGEKVMPFLEEQGMVGRAQRKVWKASFLMP
jgi:hypothetical protein